MKSNNFIDLTGQHFGLLLVVEQAERVKPKIARWKCVCECGATKIVDGRHLRENKILSCGCFLKGLRGYMSRTHGKTDTAEYRTWCGMKRRCYNQNEKCYPRYGGAGISICDAWKDSFETFLNDMGVRPSPQHSIDRIDSSGNYEPTNCRWATRKVQTGNRKSNVHLTLNGQTFILSEWAERTGLSDSNIRQRLKMGWSIERALTEPVRSAK